MITIHCDGERRATASLVPYARNSRTHSPAQLEQLVASMREWGFTAPVVVDEVDGIVAGHGRVMAAAKLGMPEVPVIVAAGWSEDQKRAYVIADNRLALNAGWDEDLLAAEMSDLRSLGFDLGLTGFSGEELVDLLTVEGREGATADDVAPLAPSLPFAQPGEVWTCGDHRVLCGDATKPLAIALLLGGGSADLLLTEPPSAVEESAPGALRGFLAAGLGAALTGLRPGGAFYVWHDDREGFAFRMACADAGMRVRQCVIWKKPALVADRQDYHSRHEPCLYGWKDGAAHRWSSDRKQTTILDFPMPAGSGDPTAKPVTLFEYLLRNNTRGQDVVLDPFAGAGATLIAAEKNGRRARVMDLDPACVDVMLDRWEAFSGREATLASTGQSWTAVRAARAADRGEKEISG
jgi:DNA modification methylase